MIFFFSKKTVMCIIRAMFLTFVFFVLKMKISKKGQIPLKAGPPPKKKTKIHFRSLRA